MSNIRPALTARPLVETVRKSAPASADRFPPAPSICDAIRSAVRVAVPLVRSSARMVAAPSRPAGSCLDPPPNVKDRLMMGSSWFSTTITSSPFANLDSCTAGNWKGRSGPTGGGVVGYWARARLTGKPARRPSKTPTRIDPSALFLFRRTAGLIRPPRADARRIRQRPLPG